MSEKEKKARVSQAARRAEVIDAALVEFGQYGYSGTSTSMIASRAGIRQPYIYALFENKRALFLACHDVLNDQIRETFRQSFDPGDSPYERLRKMGLAYLGLLHDDPRMLCHLQIFAAAGSADLREPVREGFDRLFNDVVEISGGTREEVAKFFASGVLLNALAALDEPFEMFTLLQVTPEDQL